MPDALVDIILPAYNQDKYIAQAIESVLMQKCSYRFRLIIGDDSSSDNTRKICESFVKDNPETILLMPAEANLGLAKNYQRLFNACTAKYIAIIEGDDFWTDPLKLQKQTDILESDNEVGLVHTGCNVLYEDGMLKTNFHLHQSKLNYHDLYKEIISGRYLITSVTVCFRKELLDKFIDFNFCVQNNLKTIDAFLWPQFAVYSKVFFLEDITTCYRNLASSLSNSTDFNKMEAFIGTGELIINYLIKKFPVTPEKAVLFLRSIPAYQHTLNCIKHKRIKKAREYSKKLYLGKAKYLYIYLLTNIPFFFIFFLLEDKMRVQGSLIKQKVFGKLKHISDSTNRMRL